MRFAFPGDDTDWALIEPEHGLMRHLAGALPVWAPRIAFGEGRAALPLNGRVEPWRVTPPLLPGRHIGRLFEGPYTDGPHLLAALMGAPPLGRPNAHRCIVGYLAAMACGEPGLTTLGPVLMTADEFGPEGPDLDARRMTIRARIEALDVDQGLRTGDVVVLGSAALGPQQWSALWNRSAPPFSTVATPTARAAPAARATPTKPMLWCRR